MSSASSFIHGVLKRRAIILALSLGLLLLGAFSFKQLPIEPYPNISPLNVQIISQWAGRSTLEVERQLTIPIETALAGVPEVKSFRSVSLFGLSVVTLQFREGADAFKARHDVQLYLTNANLPQNVQPSLSPDADALGEVMRYRVESDRHDLITIKAYQDWEIYKLLKTVPGVADITGFGGMVKQYQVQPIPAKLLAYDVSLPQLVTALTNANANVGGDTLAAGEQRYVVRGVGLIRSLEDIRNIVVAVNQGVPVRVGDVSNVTLGYAPRLGQVQYNDRDETVEGIVLMRRGGNATEMLDKVRTRISEINQSGQLPEGMKMVPFYDRQNLLDLTTHTVKHALFFGITLVLVVLYTFLGNFRAAILVAAVIPLALCVSFVGMHLFKVPANLISLGAIDFGLIVDAAVIVIENIMRKLEEGETHLWPAIITATAEVQRAMIFSTGIIITAYSPLFIMGGVEGKIFHPMAMTMGLALMASIVLSLTFIPAAGSFMFKGGVKPHAPRFVGWILKVYEPLLVKLLDRPKTVLSVALVAFALAVLSAIKLGTSFLPTLEENNLWIRVTLPNTVDLSYSSQVAKNIRSFIYQQPEVQNVTVQIGRPDDGTDSTGVFNLEFATFFKHPDTWPAGETREDIIKRLESELKRIPGIEYNFSQYIQDNVAEAISGVKGENSVKIFGDDLVQLEQKAIQVQGILRSIQGVADVGIFRELGQPTLNVAVDRAAAARFGLNVADIESLVTNAIGGAPATSILEGERSFDLAVRFPEVNRNTVDKIGNMLVDTPDSQRIPLSMVAKVEIADGPFFIYREGALRYIAIKFGVRERDLGSAVAEAQQRVNAEVELPRGYRVKWDGQFNQMKEAQQKLAVIIPLTLLTIFLLLYTTFGNARDAGLVLLNVPFAAIGGIAALHLAGEDLSISAGIGFLSLFGIAIQDGVILISYVKKLYDEKAGTLRDAVIQGASLRLRPVLMTALLAGLGLLPAALSHAIGSQAQRPLALVIVGGMITTTLLTLLVLPVVFYRTHERRAKPRD
ncbi:CusA/CzcA family heavy metal efflux RND transporter [Oryzomicrobium sp.]|uniref:efflux RND transporter permease subunit n=1 Tax=Oryzomicrobium sp. TaxID=1911578 RepID=UPI0025FACBD2|nr:CusA/CzcA family heavy metal efflux RND transporter [Oryzomicrobium sp.]MCE1244533.1 CusA/CzcA family heavy metal efflux RND transporter [Oryzomicrobium sp.]